jgi:hypothetical protein
MTMHLTDEQFTSYLLGAPDADVREHLERCAECRTEAHLLSETVLEAGIALRSEAARAQTRALERSVAGSHEARRPKRQMPWMLAPVLATVLIAAALFFVSSSDMVDGLWQRSGSSPVNQPPQSLAADDSTRKASQPQTANSANHTATAQDDDALLLSIQEDASREVPAALEPAKVIVDERDRIAELRNTNEGH